MDPTDQHPMLRAKRPIIVTRPCERMAGDSKNSIEIGADAQWIDGYGRFGKTLAYRILTQTDLWRPFPLYFVEYTYTKPAKSSEGYFAASFLLQDHQTVSSSAMSNVSLMRVVNRWRSEAARAGAEVICVGINEANRLTESDLEHVVSIVNELERSTRAFFFLINQIDAQSNVRGALDRRPPPHILGRLFTTSHHFTGLLWDVPGDETAIQLVSDVALACREYDENLVWPEGSRVTYTQYFAPRAYARGWRLSTQLDLIRETIDAVRAENALPAVKDWPMITFERFVYYVLVRIAYDAPDFIELTPEMVRDALHRVAYLHHEPGYKGAHA